MTPTNTPLSLTRRLATIAAIALAFAASPSYCADASVAKPTSISAGAPSTDASKLTEAEKTAAEKAAAEKALEDKMAAEKAAADEKIAAQKAAAEKLAAEKAAAEKAVADKIAAEKAAADKLNADNPVPAGWAKNETFNTGDTAWMLTSCALVLLMTMPGLALFYGGMARTKNVINTFMLVFCTAVLSAAIWVLVGYSIAFTPGNGFFGGLDKAFFSHMTFIKGPIMMGAVHEAANNIPESVYAMFQMTFAMITPALIIGGFVERVKFTAAMIFIAIWDLLVYAPVAHWVWGPGGWLAGLGTLDFAGGTVVHIASGTAGLAFALVAGRRNGFPTEPMPPSNLSLTLAGACMLWVGWFGFNAGSATAANVIAGSAMLVTQIAAVFGTIAWVLIEWIKRGKPTILGAATGAIAGLVAITPAAGFVSPDSAILIGLAGGMASWFGSTTLKRIMKIDDSMDAFGVHGVSGMVGTVLTGVFATAAMAGSIPSVITQVYAFLAVATWSFFVSLIVLLVMSRTMGLRVSAAQETKGLDISLHGESIEH